MIRHAVIFRLKHAAGSQAEKEFFEKSLALAELPTVKNFERTKQVSAKNKFAYGFSMEFDDQAAYDAYDRHPVHRDYVRHVWVPNVADFLEIDTVTF